jgi:hypothetical protein
MAGSATTPQASGTSPYTLLLTIGKHCTMMVPHVPARRSGVGETDFVPNIPEIKELNNCLLSAQD